jgi:copper chaperone CopZ
MKRVFELEELDCAHCAMKMEDAIRKIEGVNSVSINFLSQKMAIEAEESSFPEIIKKAQKEIKKVDRNCRIIL